MIEPAMKPAIRAEDWAKETVCLDIGVGLVWAELLKGYKDGHQRLGGGEVEHTPEPWLWIGWNSSAEGHYVSNRHALAALCLHGQPFGFTWEDVEAVRNVHFDVGESSLSWVRLSVAQYDRLLSLADRIASLLPPREG